MAGSREGVLGRLADSHSWGTCNGAWGTSLHLWWPLASKWAKPGSCEVVLSEHTKAEKGSVQTKRGQMAGKAVETTGRYPRAYAPGSSLLWSLAILGSLTWQYPSYVGNKMVECDKNKDWGERMRHSLTSFEGSGSHGRVLSRVWPRIRNHLYKHHPGSA